MTKNKKRIIYLVSFLVLLAVEILIGLFVHDNFIRPYIGDVLVVIVLYCFLRIFIPEGIRLLPFYIFLFAVLTEVLQYFSFAQYLGNGNPLVNTVLGATFDWMDIACYGIGCALLGVIEIFINKKKIDKSKRS